MGAPKKKRGFRGGDAKATGEKGRAVRRGATLDAHVDDVKVECLSAGEESCVIEQGGQDDEQLNGLGRKFLDSPVTLQDGDVASTSKEIVFVHSAAQAQRIWTLTAVLHTS